MIGTVITIVTLLAVLAGFHVLWGKSKSRALEVAGLVGLVGVFLALTGMGVELGANWLRGEQAVSFFFVSVVAFSGAGIISAVEKAKA